MGIKTGISWCDHTFNPWWGCEKVSPACEHCYAEAWAKRYGYDVFGVDKPRRFFGDRYWREPLAWNAAAVSAGVRRRVFCGSMCDVFEGDDSGANETDYARDRLWDLIHETPHLDWLLLTKRPESVLNMVPSEWSDPDGVKRNCAYMSTDELEVIPDRPLGWPANAWLGVTAENQAMADKRVPILLQIPAPVRFLSCEPLLGPIDLYTIQAIDDLSERFNFNCLIRTVDGKSSTGIDWVIAGGESGPDARPTHPDWVRSLRDQCQAAGVPFFFKQWGEYGASAITVVSGEPVFRRFTTFQEWTQKATGWLDDGDVCIGLDGRACNRGEDFEAARYPVAVLRRVGKTAAGRTLDGREWSETPEVKPCH